MTQESYISSLCNLNKEAIIVGSLGTISYDLSKIEHPNKILIKGAMGAAIPCALGIALNTKKKVICIVGEGSFLMTMGCIATVQKHKPKNLHIIIINNGCYNSCGGQKNDFDSIKYLVGNLYEVFTPTL